MEKLSERLISLLTVGGKTTGTMVGAYSYIEEELYCDEAKEVLAFCVWVDKEIGGCSRYNMAELFLAFKNPDDKVYAAFANQVKDKIEEINRLTNKMKG